MLSLRNSSFIAAVIIALAIVTAVGCGKKERPSLSREMRSEESREPVRARESASEETSYDNAAPPPSESTSESASSADANATPSSPPRVGVTAIKEENGSLTITLNDALVIRNVNVRSGQNGEFVAYPERRDDEGKYWSYVRINDYGILLDQIKNRRLSNGPSGFSISKTSVRMFQGSTSKRKAMVQFELEGVVTLYSWAIIEGAKGPFLVPPSEKEGTEYKDIVYAARPELRKALEDAALAEYRKLGGR